MSSDDLLNAPDARDEHALNRLLRQAAGDSKSDVLWPSEVAIVSYINGGGTNQEREQIQQLLATSAEFRRFMAQTAELIQGTEKADASNAFDRVKVPRLAKIEALAPRVKSRFDLSGFLANFLRPRVLVPVLSTAAVGLLVLAVTRQTLGPHAIIPLRVDSEVDAALFSPVEKRGIQTQPVARIGATPRLAAINAFRQVLSYNWETGETTIDTTSIHMEKAETQMTLQIVDTVSGEKRKISLGLPRSAAAHTESLSLWMYDAASRTLSQAAVTGRNDAIAAGPVGVRLRLFTLCYPLDSAFAAAPAAVVSPQR